MLQRLFDLQGHGVTVRSEAFAGLTTFLTMAYIIAVNPSILGAAGLPPAAVASATCLAAGAGCLLMGLLANIPLALAPGMGLNAYFAYTVVLGMHVPWPTALGCVFLSGLAFLVLTLAGVRQRIVSALPPSLYAAAAGGIGLFIAFIGLRNAGVVVPSPATAVALGDLRAPGAVLALAGVVLVALLQALRVKSAFLIGIVAISVAAALVGLPRSAPPTTDLRALGGVAFRLDVPAALNLGGGSGAGLLEIVFVFLFVDVFDNIGTLIGVAKRAGLMGPDGAIPRLNRIMVADSLATMAGAVLGTSTVTSYIESAAGVSAGGRTGLTSVVTGLLFFAALFIAPLAAAAPAAATAPALILVGALMIASVREVDWADPTLAVPAFFTLAMIPLTYSIANGLAFGIASHAILKLLSGRARRSDALLLGLGALCVARFVYLAAG